MTRINLEMPDQLAAWIDEQTERKGFSSPAEFVAHLIDQARQRDRAAEQIDQALLRSIASGPSTPMTQADWDYIREEGRRKLDAS